ncbi:MAG: TonB-dependent receptor [Acidobacteriota bacterium]|nr:TonB-dependent receptor [Acidobacteriota bacterium]
MKVLYGLLSLCLLSVAICAQKAETSIIRGSVADSAGNPVGGAEVTVYANEVPAKTYKAVTREDGSYLVKVPSGNARVFARKTYGVQSRYSDVLKARIAVNTETRVDLILKEVAGISEIVAVTISTGTSQPFSEVSKSVDVIDAGNIRDRNENSIADALRTAPGFRIQQLGGFGRTASIKTRGLRNQDTAVLLDGQRLRDPASITGDASAFISDLSTVNIGRIEVLRGSGSSVYGTNAIGGVVDVNTKQATEGLHGSFQSEYGGLGYTRFQGDAGYGTSGGRFGITAGLARTGVTRGIDGEDDANSTSFRGRFDGRPSDRISLFGTFTFSDAFVRLNANPDMTGTAPSATIIDAVSGVNFLPDANDPDNYQRSDFYAVQFNGAFIVNSKTVFSAGYQGLKTQRENENGGLGPGFQPFGGTQFSFFDGRIHNLNTKIDWAPTSNGRIIAGYEFELEKYANEGLGPAPSNEYLTAVDQSGSTFFVQYLRSILARRLQIAGGFRVQTFSLQTPSFSVSNAPYAGIDPSSPPSAYTFDGAASYFFEGSKTKIRMHIGNGYRVPSLYERFGSFYSSFSQSFTILGDPNLEPERSVAIDAGVDQDLAKGRVNLSATYFYTRLTDTIGYGNTVPDIGPDPRPFGGYVNTKGGLARGFEFSARVSPRNATSVFSSYSFTNGDQREPQIVGSGIIDTLGIPKHRFTLNATQRFQRRLSLNFDFEATSRYLAPIFSTSAFSTYIYRFGGNRRGDLTAGYELPVFNESAKAVFFASVENIFGYSYFENGFATVGRTVKTGVLFEF